MEGHRSRASARGYLQIRKSAKASGLVCCYEKSDDFDHRTRASGVSQVEATVGAPVGQHVLADAMSAPAANGIVETCMPTRRGSRRLLHDPGWDLRGNQSLFSCSSCDVI